MYSYQLKMWTLHYYKMPPERRLNKENNDCYQPSIIMNCYQCHCNNSLLGKGNSISILGEDFCHKMVKYLILFMTAVDITVGVVVEGPTCGEHEATKGFL